MDSYRPGDSYDQAQDRRRYDRHESRRGRGSQWRGRRDYDHPPPNKRPYYGRDSYGEDDDIYTEPVQYGPPAYRGENDASSDGQPMRLLLVRGLKESLNEELLVKGLSKLYHEDTDSDGVGAPVDSLWRILIIRDRLTDQHMQFGFLEYHTLPDAMAAMKKAEVLGDKLTIASKAIQVSYPHQYVFPRADFGGYEKSVQYTVFMPITGARHKYHDDRYYAAEKVLNPNPPGARASPVASDSGASAKSGKSANVTSETKEASKKRKAAAFTLPAAFQRWQNKAAALREEEEKTATSREKAKSMKSSQAPASGVNAIVATAATPPPADEPKEQTFCVDTEAGKFCWLCASAFKTSEGIEQHLRLSEAHKKKLADPEAVKQGYTRLKNKKVDPNSTVKAPAPPAEPSEAPPAGITPPKPQYRDRAAERRKEEAETAKVNSSTSTVMPSFSLKNRNPPPSSTPPAEPSYGKGLNLLKKAGWTAGQGLGAASDGSTGGITQPIEQGMYAAGVGLGHESSRVGDAVVEAERRTKEDGRLGFLEKTKETARKRFESLK